MANAGAQPSASLAPNIDNPNNHEPPFSGDRNFAIHGEIMLLVLVLLFACFFFSIVYLLCKRRPDKNTYYDTPKLGLSEPTTPMNSAVAMFKVQLKDGLNLMPESNSNNAGGYKRTQLPV